MARKLKTLTRQEDKKLTEAVRISAKQIWQAGLGAFAKAQAEGDHAFEKLVKEGTDLQNQTRSKQASGTWNKLEQVFEDRVSRSLANLGMPTQKDFQALNKRVDELRKTVAAFSGKKSAVAKKSVTKKAPLEPAAKKSVAPKTAATKKPRAAAK